MKKINTVTMVVTKTLEILNWLAALFATVLAVCCAVAGDWIKGILGGVITDAGNLLETNGFEINVVDSIGSVNTTAVMLFAICAVIHSGLMAMIFRNIYLVIKRSKNESPFCKDNIRMIKEIGIFSIAVPIVSLIMSIIICGVSGLIGLDIVEVSVGLDSLITGIIVLCLTQFFVHGAKLEKDVDGLV